MRVIVRNASSLTLGRQKTLIGDLKINKMIDFVGLWRVQMVFLFDWKVLNDVPVNDVASSLCLAVFFEIYSMPLNDFKTLFIFI